MQEMLKGLKPENVFQYFEEICRIPHGSGNTKAISDYCAHIAEEAGLDCVQDAWNNLIIKKNASIGYEAAPVVMLQGHLDMVNEKTTASSHDFSKDPLDLRIEGDWICAKDTTLGGDDGIAIAYMLAVLTDRSLAHPALECVFTVDEEVGLEGANQINLSQCQAEYLINLDSEEEGIFLTSCAGGMRIDLKLPVQRKRTEGEIIELTLDHLAGGHSGAEIHKERANADHLMGRLLFELLNEEDEIPFSCVSCDGGTKDNAIPRTCKARLVSYLGKEELEQKAREKFVVYQKEYQLTDSGMTLDFYPLGQGTEQAMTFQSQSKLLFLLRMMPDGVQNRSMAINDLVETSLNLGIMKTEQEHISLGISVRSSVNSRKYELVEKLEFLIEFLGGGASAHGDYPGWEYQADSRLRPLMAEIWEELFGKKPLLQAIHAGLECGILSGKMPELDIVSMGPDMRDIHTPQEKLSISSTERCYQFLTEVLRRIR